VSRSDTREPDRRDLDGWVRRLEAALATSAAHARERPGERAAVRELRLRLRLARQAADNLLLGRARDPRPERIARRAEAVEQELATLLARVTRIAVGPTHGPGEGGRRDGGGERSPSR
jgi:hypothetical protein